MTQSSGAAETCALHGGEFQSAIHIFHRVPLAVGTALHKNVLAGVHDQLYPGHELHSPRDRLLSAHHHLRWYTDGSSSTVPRLARDAAAVVRDNHAGGLAHDLLVRDEPSHVGRDDHPHDAAPLEAPLDHHSPADLPVLRASLRRSGDHCRVQLPGQRLQSRRHRQAFRDVFGCACPRRGRLHDRANVGSTVLPAGEAVGRRGPTAPHQLDPNGTGRKLTAPPPRVRGGQRRGHHFAAEVQGRPPRLIMTEHEAHGPDPSNCLTRRPPPYAPGQGGHVPHGRRSPTLNGRGNTPACATGIAMRRRLLKRHEWEPGAPQHR
eukprot:CAMPEP_0206312188 /NCGR_PEP_ID=MMETSP0106_2-20121207/13859_1 /ASSEMBLY_ACC=CAM_ASM_000206 /TAXON_ID=81532 /ORGANISM="Acanthoeca-like sp., Strain 10tr" /LENGTH=319 /DNA_ID=CAMNT_0053743477 /DNA_START=56 /DNA_END=1013 /DNA_ORIENTATION=+